MSEVDEFQEFQQFYDDHFGTAVSQPEPPRYEDAEDDVEADLSSEETDVVEQFMDWKAFLSVFFKSLKGISKYHIFTFSGAYLGEDVVQRESGGGEEKFVLLKDPEHRFLTDERPACIRAAGLSHERQRYLYKHVRPHVLEMYRDTTCPAPSEE